MSGIERIGMLKLKLKLRRASMFMSTSYRQATKTNFNLEPRLNGSILCRQDSRLKEKVPSICLLIRHEARMGTSPPTTTLQFNLIQCSSDT